MDAAEREIFQFLKSWGGEFVNGREVARRAAGKKKFHDDPDWAKPLLTRMVERGILEDDMLGRYRIKPLPGNKKHSRWVSPDIAKILAESGVKVEEVGNTGGEVASDEYYEQL